MHLEPGSTGSGYSAGFVLWMDGDDEQEDELEDVQKGIVKPPTDDEGDGEVFDPNKGDEELQKKDEAGL